MTKKISRAFRALLFLLRHPYSLLRVYEYTNAHQDEVIRKYNLPKGLPVVDIIELLGVINDAVSPYSFLEGTSTPLDLALLKGLAKKFQGGEYLEIGTWRGESVVNLASTGIHCTTFNLSDEQLTSRDISEKIIKLQGFYSKKNPAIHHIYGDTRTFDFSSLNKKFDLLFIDGDHNFDIVINDTAKMFQLLKDENSIIVWHDYGNTPEDIRWDVLHGILEGTPKQYRKNLYRVSNTLCAIFTMQKIKSYHAEFPETPRHEFAIRINSK